MTHLSPSPSPTPSIADSPSSSVSKRKRSSTTPTDDASATSSPKRRSPPPPPPGLPPPIIPYPQQHLVPFYPVYIPLPASSTSTPGDPPRPGSLGTSPVITGHPPAAAYYSPTTGTSGPFYGHCPTPSPRPATADEREQARRVSHSAIERRRRERINDKIVQLRQLIPSCADQDHLNKMTILQGAIDYISLLKKMVENKGGAHPESLKLDTLKIQSPRSMMPKEVAPFTTQFALNPPPPSNAEPPTRGIKPKDIIDRKPNGRSPTPASLDQTGSGNMSVDAMLCGE